jgi:hypothetical protein
VQPLSVALAGAVAIVAGCDAGRSLSACVCPEERDVVLPLPVDPAGKKVNVGAEACGAWYDAKDNAVIVAGAGGSGSGCLISVSVPMAGAFEGAVAFAYAGRECGWRATGVAESLTPVWDVHPCNGPGPDLSWLPLPAYTAGKVVDVTCDCCEASYGAAMNSVTISTASAPVCTIVVSLADGTALSAQARYKLVPPSPCTGDGYYTNALDASAFAPLDGGAPLCSR